MKKERFWVYGEKRIGMLNFGYEPCLVPVESWAGSLVIQENVRTPF